MANYNEYNSARLAIKNMIDNKRDQIDELENEVYNLRKSMRILDTEFKEKMDKKELPSDFH